MQLQGYKTSHTRRRLSGQLRKHGAQSGLSTPGMFLFGSAFVAVGTYIILIGTKLLPVDPAKVHAPYWVLTAAGAAFASAGTWCWSMAIQQYAANKNRRQAARTHPDEPALQDYRWDARGFRPPRWKPAFLMLVMALFVTVFLSMFNWWAYSAGGPLFLKIIIGLFDLILLALWYSAFMRVGRAIKFGDSRIEFLTFPYRISQPVVIRWRAANGIVQVNKGTFTLRCVEEWFEARGSGDNRSNTMIHEEVWSGTWSLQEPQSFTRAEEAELRFDPPAKLPVTSLSAGRTVFWELEVKLDLPGLDFEERYLVPVY